MTNRDLRRALSDVAKDLWGSPAPAPAEPTEDAAFAPSFPPFEQLWITADESIDWTDALAHAAPTDGITPPDKWSLLHKHAAQVLSGDLNAYLEVLKAVDPLKDLSPYAAAFHVETTSADCLTLRITAAPAYMQGTEEEVRRYLCGLSLRAARDLMALLPVCRVCVHVQKEEKALLDVAFDRAEMQKVRFSFLDPVTFALQCGAKFDA